MTSEQDDEREDHHDVDRMLPVHAGDEQEVERVGVGTRLRECVPRREDHDRENRQCRGRPEEQAARRTAREPEREDEEEKRRQRRQVASEQVRRETRREEPHLQDDHRHGDACHRDEGTRPRVLFAAARGGDRHEHECCGGSEPGCERDEGEVVERKPEGAAERIAAAQRRLVRADHPRERGEKERRGGEHDPRRPEPAQPAEVPGEQRVEDGAAREDRDERDRLRARRTRDENRDERRHLVERAARRNGAHDRKQREGSDRIEQHLGHHETRIEKDRRGDGQRRREECVARRHQLATDPEDRHGRQRDEERLQELQRCVPARDAPRGKRHTGERGVEEAVPGSFPAQRDRPVTPEGHRPCGIDRLVGKDPQAVQASAREPVEDDRDDEDAEQTCDR